MSHQSSVAKAATESCLIASPAVHDLVVWIWLLISKQIACVHFWSEVLGGTAGVSQQLCPHEMRLDECPCQHMMRKEVTR